MPHRQFVEQVRMHPEQGAYIEGVPNYAARYEYGAWAALSMALRYWARPVHLSALRNEISPDAIMLGLFQALEKNLWTRDVWVAFSEGSVDALKPRVRAGIPVVVLFRENPSDPATRRFGVVVGYDDVHRRLLLHEGRKRPVIRRYEDFAERWRAEHQRMLVICPPDIDRWEMGAAEYFGRAQYYQQDGRIEEAIRDYETVIRMQPEQAVAYIKLGNIHRALGHFDKAETHYRQAIRADPQNGSAYNNLAYILAEQARTLDEAVLLAQQAYYLEPTNPTVLDTLGYALYRQGEFRKAEETLEHARSRARDLPPDKQARIALHLVWVHVQSGNPHLAREVLADAVALDPGLNVPDELRRLLPRSD